MLFYSDRNRPVMISCYATRCFNFKKDVFLKRMLMFVFKKDVDI